jgi:hypothetical protein
MIPKLIIQTGPPTIPLLLQAAIVNVKLLHPEFEYRFYDDAMIDAFVEAEFPAYKKDYLSFPFRIQRYDFFRYLAIYRFGGFYLDLDMFLARELTPLLAYKCIFPFEELTEARYFWKQFRMDWQIGNYAFGAEPGHPFLAAVIQNCLRAKQMSTWVKPMMQGIPSTLKNDLYVLNTTGPGMLSRTLAENSQFADIKILFPEDVCNRGNWHHFGEFGVHNMSGSWRRESSLVNRLVTRVWKQRTLYRIVEEGRARGKTRSLQSLAQQRTKEWSASSV